MDIILNRYVVWNQVSISLSFIAFGLGILVLIGYLAFLMGISDSKARYDFIAKYEIKVLWIAAIFMLVGASCFFNSSFTELSIVWVSTRIFTTVSMAIIVGLIIKNLLQFYYPFYIEGRLKRLRYKPRISPKTGKEMKLLTEEEEDVYLDEGMQAEENLFSVDYDVWRDEETGFIKIEKYSGHLHARECPECGYQTLKLDYEQKTKEPEAGLPGELIKHYKCIYCNYKAAEKVALHAPTKAHDTQDHSS